MGISFF